MLTRSSPDDYVSPFGSNRRSVAVWLMLSSVALLLVSAILIAPVALASGHPFLGLTLYQGFSQLCHQIPERSFFIFGHKFAVCARCTGLYSGFAGAAVLYPLVRSLRVTNTPSRNWLLLATIPMALDVGLTFFDLWENTHWSRFLTGVLLGGTAVFFVMPALIDLSTRDRRSPSPTKSFAFSEFSREQIATAPSDYSAPHRRI